MTTASGAMPATDLTALPHRRARLLRYTVWQARDYLLNRGAPTVIVALLAGYLGVSSMFTALDRPGNPPLFLIKRHGSVEAARLAMMHDASMGLVATFAGLLAFFGALLAMNGIVSNDRKLGFYRFLFAKPMTPSAYYGSEFAVNGLCLMLIVAALAWLYGAIVEPVLSVPLLIAIAAGYLCYAGLGFALSAISRWDWLSLVAVAGTADLLWKLYGDSASPFATLLNLLPPVNRTTSVYSAAAHGLALPWHSVLWLAGYGAVMFVIGLAILRHRRLAFN